MEKYPRRLSFLTAVVGLLLLGTTIWYWFVQRLHFFLEGNWMPILAGVSGALLMLFGATAFRFFGSPHDGLHRRQALRIIVRKTLRSIATIMLLAVDIGGIAVAFAAVPLCFGVLRNGGSVLLPIAGGLLAYFTHLGAEFLLKKMEKKRPLVEIGTPSPRD